MGDQEEKEVVTIMETGVVKNRLKPGVLGAMSELRVCVDLLSKEYEVFRSVSPHCTCDLIAFKNKRFYRIEVRTGLVFTDQDGTRSYPVTAEDRGRFDVLAVVSQKTGSIVYEPPL